MLELNKIYHGDCLDVMNNIEDGSIDCIITDPPYGTTACKWDTVIPFVDMWKQLNRIIKPNGAIVLFGSEPFSSYLRLSNISSYKYDWIWDKSKGINFFHAKNSPLKICENILVFSRSNIRHKSTHNNNRMVYNPQGLIKIDKDWSRPKCYVNELRLNRPSHNLSRTIEYTNYPNMKLKFIRDKEKIHPTQKPVALMEYLIKTYTNENETVLDFTIGSGTTAIAAMNTSRSFIGIEKNEEYFNLANERIANHVIEKQSENLLDQFMEI